MADVHIKVGRDVHGREHHLWNAEQTFQMSLEWLDGVVPFHPKMYLLPFLL